jgi:hypothetical protein
MHAGEIHAGEVHTYENAYETHACRMYAYEVDAREIHGVRSLVKRGAMISTGGMRCIAVPLQLGLGVQRLVE